MIATANAAYLAQSCARFQMLSVCWQPDSAFISIIAVAFKNNKLERKLNSQQTKSRSAAALMLLRLFDESQVNMADLGAL